MEEENKKIPEWIKEMIASGHSSFYKYIDGELSYYDLNDKDMYFAHSYSMNCDKIYIAATSNYGSSFVSGVQYKNIFGIQSHPEKSAFLGSIFFTNFLNLR